MVSTEQEVFWQGKFGDDYIDRNSNHSTINHYSKILINNRINIKSAIELGANIGINLDSLKQIFPKCKTFGVEINKKAHSILNKKHASFCGSVYDFNTKETYNISYSSCVLIHQNPEKLDQFYTKLYTLSNKYILINEYFSPSPVEISYRDNRDKLFKRDFAKEFWEKYPELSLIDYGFFWSKDSYTWGDDSNWFLFSKKDII